jgi:ubiquinol-cytochrome c reductase cytochrome b subunit
MWFHKFLAERGYCSPQRPRLLTRIGKKGKMRFYYRIRTWTFSSFNWIGEAFYFNGTKIVPCCIGDFLTPLALAVWIMDDGGAVSAGMKLSTHAFTFEEVAFLCKILQSKYGLKAQPNPDGYQYVIYISKASMADLSKIVKSHMIPSMHYKLNNF